MYTSLSIKTNTLSTVHTSGMAKSTTMLLQLQLEQLMDCVASFCRKISFPLEYRICKYLQRQITTTRRTISRRFDGSEVPRTHFVLTAIFQVTWDKSPP